MRKAITFILLLFANLILLAHSVVPHHHLSRVVICLTNTHGTSNNTDHENDGHHHDADHPEGAQDTEDCVSNHIYTHLSNESRTLFSTENPDFSFSLIPESALNNQESVISSLEQKIPFRQKPYLVFYQNSFISLFNGLRAPPVS